MRWREQAWDRRAKRAIDRQLDFMRGLAESLRGREAEKNERLNVRATLFREKLMPVRPLQEDDRVLEVGSGASGYIFHLGLKNAVGIDPLADHCRELFRYWQEGVKTIACGGEELPFGDDGFDVVISDNVIDHAENPKKIIAEISRVLKPGGLFYFTVHVHHPMYHIASSAYGALRALGVPWEVTPFADHTVHLTPASAREMFSKFPLSIRWERYEDEPRRPPRHTGDRLKWVFYKNRTWEVIAIREPLPLS